MERTRKKVQNVDVEVFEKRDYPTPAVETAKWKDEFIHQVYILALLGASDSQIADCFNTTTTTIQAWKTNKEEFFLAMQEGKTLANAKVAASLYMKAVGFERDEEEIHMAYGKVIRVPVKKYYPPDSWAAAKILALRESANWSEKKIGGEGTNININNINFNILSMDELKSLRDIQKKLTTQVSSGQ